ncbi:hypothetical protein M9H77_06140 [Catharanthus roseus]|uniref:Uncharacterized protein n=1 Tax=Catharanthus roseus TaxID=4058 RepID=A0ACC0BR95_CATRO|nr:hypothetical protein M9H77_06140 [Catharanthus roseus]
MNEQPSMMNQHQQQQMMNPPPPPMVTSMGQPPPPQMMSQHHQQQQQPQVIKNPRQIFPSAPSGRNFSSSINYLKPPKFEISSSGFSSQNSQKSQSNSQIPMNVPQSQQPPQMMNRGYGMWGPLPQPMDLQMNYQNPNPSLMKTQGGAFASGGKPLKHPLGPRNNWKGKKVNKPDKRMDMGRRMEKPLPMGGSTSSGTGVGGAYKPPTLNELQYQNRMKARRFFPKKNFNNKNNYNMGKFAPRNTTSFIIRAKKSGGIAELVSPCPVTPAVLPTPMFSPSREVLVDMAKEEWGVDGYGSMKGLIRLRSPGHEEEDEGGSSESDVEEHVEVERRLDHDLSRFEMIYPNYGNVGGIEYNNVLENRVDDQDTHIAQLEEENLILKERLFLMERELGDLRRRLQCLERHNHGGEEINEEVVENESDSESRGDAHSMEVNNEEMVEENVEADEEEKIHGLDAGKFQNEPELADVRGVVGESKDENEVQDVNVESNNDIRASVANENKASLEKVPQDNNGIEVNATEENNAGAVEPESRSDVRMQEEVVHDGKEMITGENQANEAAEEK